jgi:FMN phosphatase YigB (HAD superfamily)
VAFLEAVARQRARTPGHEERGATSRDPVQLHPCDAARVRHGSGLDGVFDHLLTTDAAGAFKPDPRAYQLAVSAMGLGREEIAFAAFGGWDAAGSKCFGFRTFWINRQALPVEELGVEPDTIVSTLAEMAALLPTMA